MALQAQKACEQGVPVMARRNDVMGCIAPADTHNSLTCWVAASSFPRRAAGAPVGWSQRQLPNTSGEAAQDLWRRCDPSKLSGMQT